MEPFRRFEGIVVPLDRANVDTDQIIPKQFLKLLERTGYGQYLFYDWRFHPDGNPRADFVLNKPRYKGGKVLLARSNFGCGSSREHAAWALRDYGFRVIVAPSFADIFYSNCFKNEILPIALDEALVDRLFEEVTDQVSYSLDVDLEGQVICKPDGVSYRFDIDSFRKKCLSEGLDEISLTLQYEEKIRAHERKLESFRLIDTSR
jgi:3-isopropylmalate/(R)-2-methylmalate dehydratase small subunit